MKPRKIMLVAKSLEQGGIEVMIRETAKELRDQGYNVSVFTFGEKGQNIGKLIEEDGTHIIYGGVDELSLAKKATELGIAESELNNEHVQSLILRNMAKSDEAKPYLEALSDAIQAEKPDGIISFHAKTHLLLDELKNERTEQDVSALFPDNNTKKTYPPLPRNTKLSFCMGGLGQENYLLDQEHNAFHTALRRNRVIYCGQTVRDTYVKELFPERSASDSVFIRNHQAIPNGINCSRFTFNPKVREKTRNLLGIPQNAKVIIFPARFSPQKDVPTFVEAMQEITTQNPDTHIIMCGRGMDSQNPDLSKLVKNNPNFHLMGERKRLNGLYSASDIYANTSHFEGLSIAMLEAMACGNHPVVTPAGDAEIVTQGIGTLIPFSGYSSDKQKTPDKASVEDTVKAFQHALSESHNREIPSQRVSERYSLKAMVQGYTDFLNRQTHIGRG